MANDDSDIITLAKYYIVFAIKLQYILEMVIFISSEKSIRPLVCQLRKEGSMNF